MIPRLKEQYDKTTIENLQKKFWEMYNTSSMTKLSNNGKPLHGKIKARYGTKFLRENIIKILNEKFHILIY